jgi:ferredoxin-thioredoxin reductase catalytic subunit
MKYICPGLAVGEIPTLKTQAKLHRNIMLYELFSDYEIFHLQLKRVARNILSRMRRYMCGSCCCPNIEPNRLKPSAWLCEVHEDDEIEDDQSLNKQMFLVKFVRWLSEVIAEDDIQSSITIEKHYKKQHQRPKEEVEQEEDDDS